MIRSPSKDRPIQIYFAAALFNSKECLFNAELTDRLEKQGHNVKLP
jgi:nucleoside 2-deoxyribosyltransferase